MGEEQISEEMGAGLWDSTHPHTVTPFFKKVCGSGGAPLDFLCKQRLIETIQWMEWDDIISTRGNPSVINHLVSIDLYQSIKRNRDD